MTEPSPAGPAPSSWHRRFKIAIRILVLAIVAFVTLYIWTAFSWSYSKGERAGIIQKFSAKGWLCKTWEGEIAMTTVPGSAPVLWQFTVRNDSIAVALREMMGKEGRVVLTYEEHRGVPTSCFGETHYWVTGVRLVK